MIIINKPQILDDNSNLGGVNWVKLQSKIEIDGIEHSVWYSVEEKYSKYLCDEKADAFLVAVLPYAMASGSDIEVKDCAISESIFWRLTNEFIPTLAKFSKMYKNISIISSLTNITYESFAVGTGFSAGVDSFYTLLRNIGKETKAHNVTHVTFFNVGATGYGTDEYGNNAENVFLKRTRLFEKSVSDMGLEFIKVNSNLGTFVPMTYNWIHSYRSMSAVLALQKLFKIYYYSSEGPLSIFSLDFHDSGYYDLLNTDSFSTESTRFYSIGLWEARIDKAAYISNYPVTYEILNVCNNNATNCKTCDKCIRTMGDMYAINKLECYKDVFEVDYFKKHKVYYCRRLIEKSFDGSVESIYNKEIIEKMRENGKTVPIVSYVLAIPKIIFNLCSKMARKSKYLTKINHQKWHKKRGLYYNDIEI